MRIEVLEHKNSDGMNKVIPISEFRSQSISQLMCLLANNEIDSNLDRREIK